MSVEKIERNKAKVDWFIFVVFLMWIGLRILQDVKIEGLGLALHFIGITLVLGIGFLVMYYVYFSQKLTDELERENKLKAHKFSWNFTLISAIILYILCDKTILKFEFALELVLWISYLSYFVSFKLLDAGVDARFSDKQIKIFSVLGIMFVSTFLGMNFGYKMTKLSYNQFGENKLLYIIFAIFIVGISTVILIKFLKMAKDDTKGLKKR